MPALAPPGPQKWPLARQLLAPPESATWPVTVSEPGLVIVITDIVGGALLELVEVVNITAEA